jgi:hypothetical protein
MLNIRLHALLTDSHSATKDEKEGGTCRTCEEMRHAYKVGSGIIKELNHLPALCVTIDIIILKLVLEGKA